MPETTTSVTPSVVNCVVCGAGSHREDWQTPGDHACDKHSKAEVASAVAERAAKAKADADAAAKAKAAAQVATAPKES